MKQVVERGDVVRVARSYLDTPFHHRGRLPGVGLDCIGVPVCIWRKLGSVPPDFDVPEYGLIPDGHSMMIWCNEYLRRVAERHMRAGDMIVTIVDKYPQHIGILADYRYGGFSMIHASMAPQNRVIETRLMFSRALRFVAAFKFPGVE